MAKVNAITMQDFKGSTLTQQLTGADVFVGPNGVGKSTRLQALQTAMIGYVPGNGKRPGDTFNKFSSNSRSMTAGLQLDGFTFSRQFDRSVKAGKNGPEVKISESLSVSPSRGERTETEKKGRVAAEVGTLAMMLDFSEFTSLTDNKRRDFIYSLSGAGSADAWNKEKVEQYLIERLLTMELEIAEPDLYQTISQTIIDALKDYTDDMTIDAGLLAVRSYVTSELSVWKRKAADAEGAIRQFTEQKNNLAATERNIDQNKCDLTEKRDQLLKVETQLAQDRERKKAIDRRTARLQELENIISELQNRQAVDTSEIDGEIDQLNGEMDHSSEQELFDQLNADKERAETELDDVRRTIAVLNQESTTLHAEIASFQTTLNTIEQHKGVCVIQRQISCNKDFGAYVTHAEGEINKRKDRLNEISTEMQIAESAQDGYIKGLTAIEASKSEIMKRTQQRQQQNADRARRIQDLNQQKSHILSDEQMKLADLQRAQSERDDLLNQPVEAIAPLDMLEVQRDSLRKEISELEVSLVEQEKQRNQMQQIRKSMVSNKEAEYKAKAFKKLDEALGAKGIQGEIVKTMLEPMRAEIEHNLWLLGVQRTVFFQTESDTGQEIFQFGWEHNDHRRNYDALSTGQQLMFLIAFLVAVIDRANPQVKVLAIDNIEHLDEQNQRAILEELHGMRHRLDNIILAGVISPQIAQETGWTVHELEREEAVAATDGSGEDELGF